jgi:hypothetical protein
MLHVPEDALADDVVYRRTDKGRAALLTLPATLSPASLGFLARVNGFTDLRTLRDRDDEGGAQGSEDIGALLALGLIEVVTPDLSPLNTGHGTGLSTLEA